MTALRPLAVCRDLYHADDKTARLGPADRQRDWADGRCGQCGEPVDEHPDLVPVATADAVLARPDEPLAPVDPAVADLILGRVFGRDREYLIAAAALIPDSIGGVR